MTEPIFKIVHAADWREAETAGVYYGSGKDRTDGFLHFSTAEQVPGTLQRYYADAADLILVAVDAAALGGALRYEPSRDGALFPHLYAALPMAAVLATVALSMPVKDDFAACRAFMAASTDRR